MSQDKTELTRQKALANAKEHLFPRLRAIFNRSNTSGPVTPFGQRRAYLLLLEAYRLGVTPQDVDEYIKNQFPDKASNYLQQFKNFTSQQQQITNRHIQYARYAQQAKLSPIDSGAFAKLQEALEKENKNDIKEAYFKLRYLNYSPELIYRISSISMEEIARLEKTSTLRVKSLFDSFNGFTINLPLSEHGTLLQRAIATKNLNGAEKMIIAGALPQSLDELRLIETDYKQYQAEPRKKTTNATALQSIQNNIIDTWDNISQRNKIILKELDELSKKPYLEEAELDKA